ncbi:hypothetical protein [Streptomyces sp. NPDC090025]|uniref:hypothetical protein n=1 Tax=Streptomyces sp. NPDC090025 TaxID=3365922 RepID=UPI003834D9A6
MRRTTLSAPAPSSSLVRLAVVGLLCCLPAAVGCDDPGSDEGSGPGSGVSGGGLPGPGGGTGGTNGGAVTGPMNIPEWGRNGFLFDDGTERGRANWREIKGLFAAACADGTLCVDLARVYRTEDGGTSPGPCGYDHTEPRSGTAVPRHRTVLVVGICGPGEPEGSTEGPTDGPTDGPTGGPSEGTVEGPTGGPSEGTTDGPTGGPGEGTTGPTVEGSAPDGSAARNQGVPVR